MLARVLWTGGEVAVTIGLVVLLLVAHQMWWTNREARAGAKRQVESLERQWSADDPSVTPPSGGDDADSGGTGGRGTGSGGTGAGDTRRQSRTAIPTLRAGTPSRNQTYAVIRIPRIGLTAPVAEGISKPHVLNKGYVGHYPGTAQPGQTGNVALAGHRNTHGEPFRHLDELRPGDRVSIETFHARFTYVVERTLPRTSPSDGTVIAKVPYSSVHPRYRYTEPGSYLTLTTCTPEYTSRYRLVVWAKLTAAGPRVVGGAS
ncbi:class E sortase [Streptomyces botrytidirepellens]|uniref:class E sortase n=1 Tax=Streptomyces botrytidirepellens TaxID=2486417 RepID=UPI001FE49BE4|nr:class E sortase [Streptomyces botrytidirepellens]